MLKGIYSGLLGNKGVIPTSVNDKGELESSLPPLSDPDYEFLFMQLLEGVAHGWQSDRILKFFVKLDERGNKENWLAWLERFEEKLLASATPHQNLGRSMILLSQQMRSLHRWREIGTKAETLGRKLIRNKRSTSSQVWEYEEAPATPKKTSTGIPANLEAGTLSIEELSQRLEQDTNLRQYLAQQLGLDTKDPQTLVQAILDKAGEIKEPEPEDADAWFNLGLNYANLGSWEESLRCWDKVLELKAYSKHAWFNRGGMLLALERYEEAVESLDKAIELKPDEAETWYRRGVALSSLKKWEDAIASYDQGLELQPENWVAWINRGMAAEQSVNPENPTTSTLAQEHPDLQQRGYEGAIATYEKAFHHITPETHPEGYGRLNWAMGATYARKATQEENSAPHWQKAIENYNEALQILTPTNFPNDHLNLLKNLSHAYRSIGETEKANELQQRGAEIVQRQSQTNQPTVKSLE